MKTIYLLMARYEGLTLIPVDRIIMDYFPDMARKTVLQKIESGEVPLPIVRLGYGQKAQRSVDVNDLAVFLDKQAEIARKETRKKTGSVGFGPPV